MKAFLFFSFMAAVMAFDIAIVVSLIVIERLHQ